MKDPIKSLERISLKSIENICGTKERTLFFLTWLKHNRNATKAYLELHPDVTERSASTLGGKLLNNIDMRLIAGAYGLNVEKYFEVLKDAVDAEKWNDFTGEREKDYKTIKPYHDKLGRLLGIEKEDAVNIGEQKILVIPSEILEKYKISHEELNDSPASNSEDSSTEQL